MFLLGLSLLSAAPDYYTVSIATHISLCYLVVIVICIAVPRIQTPHLGLYIFGFWSGLGIISLAGSYAGLSLLNDLHFLFY